MRVWRGPLPLGELRPLARLLQAGLLALLRARVARQESAALELAARVGAPPQQAPGDTVTQSARLCGDAAAVQARDDVHALLIADRLQRLAEVALQSDPRQALQIGRAH